MNTNGIAQSISTIGMCVLAVSRQEVQTMQNNMQSVETAIEEQEKQIFNQKFEMYKGEDEKLSELENIIKESEEYNVDMEYNTKGLVNIITITEN